MEIFDLPESTFQDDVRIEQSIKQEKEYKLIGKARRKPGITLFSYNTQTGEMKPAEIEKECTMTFDGGVSYKAKVMIEPHCIYGQALNMKNWEKKVNKMLNAFL